MDQLTPIYRIEFFLDAIVNNSSNDLEPIYRVEFFLAKIAGEAVEIPVPLSRMEMFLAKLCGETVTLPTPQSRTEQYLAAICGEDVEIPPFPVYRIEYWLAAWAEGGSEIVTVTGIAPLALMDAVAHPLHSLTQYGKCVQDGTPTPDAPVDIVCNNGVIKARRQSGLPLGYQMVEWIKSAGAIPITGFKTKSTQEIETVFYRESRGSSYLYSSDTATSGATNTTAYLTTAGGNWRWDGKVATINPATGVKITSVQNEDGVWINGTRYGVYTDAGEFVSTNDFRLSSNENTTVRIYSMTIREGETVTLDLVPVQRVTDNAYGFYDKVSGNFYTNADATFDAGDPIDDPVEIYQDGTPEVLTITASGAEPQTVTDIPMLLSVGDVKDEAELISGHADRAITVFRVGPDMNWALATGTGYKQFYTSDTQGQLKKSVSCMSNIAPYGCTASNRASYQHGCYTGGTGNLCFQMIGEASLSTVDDWKDFLRTNGVYVVAVKAAATTEQTTPHALHTSAGTNVVDVSAEVTGVELAVEYAEKSA